MKKLLSSILILTALLLSACGAAATPAVEMPADPTQLPEYPAPGDLYDPGYAAPDTLSYPEPVEPLGESQMDASDPDAVRLDSAPWTVFPPVKEDASRVRGAFFIDRYELQEAMGNTILFVEGSLPTPCNAPRAYISKPDENNQINVELYSVADAGKVCAQVIEPFSGIVANFIGMAAGNYKVIVNGEPVGEFAVK